MSCISDVGLKEEHQRFEYGEAPIYAWTDITWLLDREGVSWGYYVAPGTCSFPPCHGPALDGPEGTTPASKNPLPGFATCTRPDSRTTSSTTGLRAERPARDAPVGGPR
jgi:hypothetical protein